VWLAFGLVGATHAAVMRDHLYGVKALSATDAWAVGNYGAIYHTQNAGQTWEARDSGTKVPLFSVDFADGQHGWTVGKSSEILATTDGGKTWAQQKSPLDASKHLFKVRAIDARTVWAVGDWGAIVVTTDGGASWIKRKLPTEKTIFGIYFASVSEGWAVGIDGLVLHTADAGVSWTVQHGNADPATIDELAFNDALKNPGMYSVAVVGKTGVVVGDTGTVLLSSDGGRTWARRVLPDRERYSWMRDVSLVAGDRGVIVGAKGLSGSIQGGEITLADGGKATAATE